MPNIGYHTRLYSDSNRKIIGGSFGGSFDTETINRLIKSQFTVIVKPSGTPVLVDRDGREVNLYLNVNVAGSEAGALAVKNWRRDAEEKEKEAQDTISSLMDELSNGEIIRRLRCARD